MNETLSQVGEALKRAAQRSSGSSDLHQQIMVTAEAISTVIEPETAMPGVTFNPSHRGQDEEVLLGQGEELSGAALEELIEVIMPPGSSRKKGAVRPQTEQELSPEAIVRERGRVQGRTHVNASLRQASTIATEQRAAEIEQERQAQAQEEQARQAQAARQERIAARDRQKEENQLLAERQRTEAAARRAKEAAERESKRAAKKAAQAAQPRRADIERQRRAVEVPIPATTVPQRSPVEKTADEQRELGKAEREYQRTGNDYFEMIFIPTAAALRGLKPEELDGRLHGLLDQLKIYSPRQQAELIRQLALGMQISETGISHFYREVYGPENNRGEVLEDFDYFLHCLSFMLGYSTPEQRLSFIGFIREEAGLTRIDLPMIYRTLAKWFTRPLDEHGNQQTPKKRKK